MNDILKEEIANIEQALESYFKNKIDTGNSINSVVGTFYNNIREYIMRGGKRLRPALITVGYKTIKENVELEKLYQAALALELLHNGSLLHDDLIDHDETRRGGPTFHVVYRNWFNDNVKPDPVKADDFGMALAILGGDALINMGAQMLTQSDLPADVGMKCLSYYQLGFQNLVEGVLLELSMVSSKDVTPELYLKMIYMKTAVLFEHALLMGATMAKATESQLNALSNFGKKMGQAFQVQDDILGSFGDEAVTGKPTDGDIREGKKTMLVIQAYRLANNEQYKTLDALLGKRDITHEEVDKVRDVLRECGALKKSHEIMDQLLNEGKSALDTANPPLVPKYKQFLLDLADFLVKRNY